MTRSRKMATMREVLRGAAGRHAHRYMATAFVLLWISALGFVLPYNNDEAAYKIVATGMVHGHWPYRDFFINRQPLTLVWYIPAGLGASLEAERILAAAAMAASIPVIGLLAARWLSPQRERLAVITYAVLLANPVMPISANTEAFMLLPLTAALAVASPIAAGVLFGVAMMTKLHALVFAPVMFVVWKRQWRSVGIATAATCLVISAPFVVVWREYWDANVWFNWSYAQYSAADRLRALRTIDWPLIAATLPLWIAAAIGLFRLKSVVLWLWIAGGILSIKASGLEYDHYYALLVPPVGLLAGEGLPYMHRHRPFRILLVMSSSIALLISGVAVYAVVSITGPGPFDDLARGVGGTRGELYVLGDHSEVYEFAGRQPERRFFSSIPLIMRPDWGERERRALLACPPDTLIVQYFGPFSVPWAPDVEKLYATRREYPVGAVLSAPIITCDPATVSSSGG